MNKKGISQNKGESVSFVGRQVIYQGEFPHPDILKGFADVIPDMPERILKMAEEQNAADVKTKNRNSLSLILGQVFTLIITLLSLACAVILAKLGMEIACIISICCTLTPILIAAIKSFRK